MSFFDSMPNELFLKLFTYMTIRELLNCRGINHRWKEIIDELIEGELFWKKKCFVDFSNVVHTARYKCCSDMHWSDLYRSLSFWSKLSEAKEVHDEFCSASTVAEEIRSFTILRHGIIGVHKRNSISYYSAERFDSINRGGITGDYLRYAENEEFTIILGFHLHMHIIRKDTVNQRFPKHVTYEEVKTFLLLEECVYYITMSDILHEVPFSDKQLKANALCQCTEGVMAMGYKSNQLHILTFQRKVYKLVGRKLTLVEALGPSSNILHQLHKCNLLELLDWRVYFQWMFVLKQSIPPGPLQDIVTTRIHGDVVFIGSNWGVLRIYYRPFILGEFDLFNTQPIKQYNFMERYDCPVLSLCPILGIDVYEVDNGHLVFVAMPKKIAVLKFTHDYMKTRTAKLQYLDKPDPEIIPEKPENMKIITIQ